MTQLEAANSEHLRSAAPQYCTGSCVVKFITLYSRTIERMNDLEDQISFARYQQLIVIEGINLGQS
jgi:hypothetical protein